MSTENNNPKISEFVMRAGSFVKRVSHEAEQEKLGMFCVVVNRDKNEATPDYGHYVFDVSIPEIAQFLAESMKNPNSPWCQAVELALFYRGLSARGITVTQEKLSLHKPGRA